MRSERSSSGKTTRVEGRRAISRGGVVSEHPAKNGCYSVSEWHIALSTKLGKAQTASRSFRDCDNRAFGTRRSGQEET